MYYKSEQFVTSMVMCTDSSHVTHMKVGEGVTSMKGPLRGPHVLWRMMGHMIH